MKRSLIFMTLILSLILGVFAFSSQKTKALHINNDVGFYLFNFNKVQYTDYDGIDYDLGVFRTIEIGGTVTNLINSFADLVNNRASYFGQANVFYFVNDVFMFNYYLADYVLNSQGERVLQVHTFLSNFYGIRITGNGISIIARDNISNDINADLFISKTYLTSQLTDVILVRQFHNEEFRKGYEQGRVEFGYNDNGTYVSSLEYGLLRYNEAANHYGMIDADGSLITAFEAMQKGYDRGIIANETSSSSIWALASGGIISAIGSFLAFELFPNFTVGLLILIPIVFGLISFIVGGKK